MISTLPKTLQTAIEQRRLTLREKAKGSLSAFCEYSGGTCDNNGWKSNKHLEILCEKVEEAEAWINGGHEEIKLIMVCIAPRHGKSEVVSRNAPAWFLGRNPDQEVIIGAHTASLAKDMSRDARRLFVDYAAPLFDLELSKETSAVELWHVANHRGKVQAAGVDGPLMGRGAALALIEDPHKSMEEAESPTYQAKDLKWIKSTLMTRMAPGAAIILVMSRLHVKDLVGQLKAEAESSGVVWEVVEFAATAQEEGIGVDGKPTGIPVGEGENGTGKPINDGTGRKQIGDALWPKRFGKKRLMQIRAVMANERMWQAMYEQNPSADVTGALWKMGLIEALRIGDGQVPKLYRTIIGWDPATTSKKTSAKHGIYVLSSGAPFYREGEESMIGALDTMHGYVRANFSGIYTPDGAVVKVIEAYDRFDATLVVAEINQGGEWLGSAIRGRNPNVHYLGITASESKKGRAEPVSGLYTQRRIHHVGKYPALELQQTTWTGPPMLSPDDLDAVVHGLAELFGLSRKGKKKARAMGKK